MTYVQPPEWPRGRGYAHGMKARGSVLCVSGQIGWDPLSLRMVEGGIAAQARQALANIATVLAAAGAQPAHVIRLTWYITERQAYLDAQSELGAAYRSVFGAHYPAMSVVVVSALLEPDALLEIEAMAVLPDG